MKSKIPEGQLISSFLGYAVVGLLLIYSPQWAVSFAIAVVLTGTSARILLKIVLMAWAAAGIVLGVVSGIKLGMIIWAWTLTGVVAGTVSEAVNELLLSFNNVPDFCNFGFNVFVGFGFGVVVWSSFAASICWWSLIGGFFGFMRSN